MSGVDAGFVASTPPTIMSMETSGPDTLEKDASFEREALPCLSDVARLARALTRNAADADDLVQETFLKAYAGWDSYQLGSECRRWLFRICRNEFARRIRRDARVMPSADPEADAIASAGLYNYAVHRGLGTIFDRIDLADALEHAIAMVPDPYRSVFALVDLQGFGYLEAAEALGVPVGTVRSRLFRARRILQEALVAFAEDAGFESRDSA